MAGGAVPEHGGLVVVTSRLNRILSIEDAARLAHVQSGVTNLAVDTAVKRHGLYFPPDPSSGRSSVIGGNIGTNAGGPHCFKYGVTTNYVQGVRMVLADGTVVRLGGPAVDYPEYDLLAAVVGGEGTLGLVTEAWLRLVADPPAVKTMMVSFDSEAHAGEAVSAVIAAGLVPATLELMDQRSMRMIEEFTGAGLPVDAGAALIVEVDGYPAGIDTQIEEVADTLQAHGGFGFRVPKVKRSVSRSGMGARARPGRFRGCRPATT
ncbi:MAG: FAD-binding protein [Caldilineaceae bacterium]